MHKVVFFLRFRDDIDRADAERDFAGRHAELVLAVPGLVRYVQNPVVTAATLAGADDERPWVDAFAALWFADRDAFAIDDGGDVMGVNAGHFEGRGLNLWEWNLPSN